MCEQIHVRPTRIPIRLPRIVCTAPRIVLRISSRFGNARDGHHNVPLEKEKSKDTIGILDVRAYDIHAAFETTTQEKKTTPHSFSDQLGKMAVAV